MRSEYQLRPIQWIVQGAVIAAIYTVLCLVFAPFAYGPIQVRIAEALCILPFFTPAAIPGVTIGCLLANILGGCALLDIVGGTLATFIGAIFSYYLRKNKYMVCIPPIVANILIVPWVLKIAYGAEEMLPFLMVTVGIGEIIAIGILGNFLLVILERYKHILFQRV